MKDKVVIQTSHLSKTYQKVPALIDANIVIKRGDIYGLVGNNGAGKTTFLKLLTGQISPSSGELMMLGASDEASLNKVRHRTGTIIETASFYPNLSAKKNLEYYRIQRGIPGKEVVDKVLKEVGLQDTRKKKFQNFSLGMKQRLGLALALMNEPELLILDEPINGLDPSGIIEIRNLLLKLNHEKNITIIISSHLLTELENIATHYAFLKEGHVIEQISAPKLKEKCKNNLQIKVTDPMKYTALLEKVLKCTDYTVLPDNVIQITNYSDDIAQYSELAIHHHIGLLSFQQKKIELEDYYMNLIETSN